MLSFGCTEIQTRAEQYLVNRVRRSAIRHSLSFISLTLFSHPSLFFDADVDVTSVTRRSPSPFPALVPRLLRPVRKIVPHIDRDRGCQIKDHPVPTVNWNSKGKRRKIRNTRVAYPVREERGKRVSSLDGIGEAESLAGLPKERGREKHERGFCIYSTYIHIYNNYFRN